MPRACAAETSSSSVYRQCSGGSGSWTVKAGELPPQAEKQTCNSQLNQKDKLAACRGSQAAGTVHTLGTQLSETTAQQKRLVLQATRSSLGHVLKPYQLWKADPASDKLLCVAVETTLQALADFPEGTSGQQPQLPPASPRPGLPTAPEEQDSISPTLQLKPGSMGQDVCWCSSQGSLATAVPVFSPPPVAVKVEPVKETLSPDCDEREKTKAVEGCSVELPGEKMEMAEYDSQNKNEGGGTRMVEHFVLCLVEVRLETADVGDSLCLGERKLKRISGDCIIYPTDMKIEPAGDSQVLAEKVQANLDTPALPAEVKEEPVDRELILIENCHVLDTLFAIAAVAMVKETYKDCRECCMMASQANDIQHAFQMVL